MTTSSKVVLTEGTVISGKWNKRTYRIERLLGEGANGKVFLVQSGKTSYALKFGFDTMDLQMEVNVLRKLDKKSGFAEPFFRDADDVELNGVTFPFYVMKYIKGVPPQAYMARNGGDWFYLIGLNLLRKLALLHRQGWVFGDLKTDNVLVSGYGQVDLVDYGGVTEKGRSVRQFTEVYDRGYWNAGERTADDGYDLFGFAVFALQLAGMDKRIQALAQTLPQSRSAEDLIRLIDECPKCRSISSVLKKAIQGKYGSSTDAADEWKKAMEKLSTTAYPRIGKPASWIKAAFVGSIGLLISSLYLFLIQ